jgi:hypothetical protein
MAKGSVVKFIDFSVRKIGRGSGRNGEIQVWIAPRCKPRPGEMRKMLELRGRGA